MKKLLLLISLVFSVLAAPYSVDGPAKAGSGPTGGEDIIVDSTTDDEFSDDVNPGDGTCADTWGDCTLRAAIQEANAQPGFNTITFDSATFVNTPTIYVDTQVRTLPSITDTVSIDASLVWDDTHDTPGVVVHGGGRSFIGLRLKTDSCTIYGLYVTGFTTGIDIESAANTIGGLAPGQRNVLSGNGTGVSLDKSTAQLNIIQNNYIGLTPAGDTKNPNRTGVLIGGGASNNIIGGNEAAKANYISGNSRSGVTIEKLGTDGNWIGGNVIGLTADGTTALGNKEYGVKVTYGASNTYIGGFGEAGNTIASNEYTGVYINESDTTTVDGNFISDNAKTGVEISESGACSVVNNEITGNLLDGVYIYGNSAQGNLIWRNSIHDNERKGIGLYTGGNTELPPPSIDDASQNGASGTSCAFCEVALYSDKSDEGEKYWDSAQADGNGDWEYIGTLGSPFVTATAIDGSNNTSEFSAPYRTAYFSYVPFAVRNW